MVRKIINARLADGQLSDCDLTLRDLETVHQVFVRSLQGIHHPRIAYPDIKPKASEAIAIDVSKPERTPV